MRLLTNPGSNLSANLIARYNVQLLPQRIVVDGVVHDTRSAPTQSDVDDWVRNAKKWPETIGTTAAESVAAFDQLVRAGERELLLVTTSKKIINSYQGAERAVRTLQDTAHGKDARIVLVDTGATDVAALLVCSFAGEAMRAGKSFDDVVNLTQAFVKEGRMLFALATLENMVKGGRTPSLRAFIADMLGVGPVLSFTDGEPQVVHKYKRRGDMIVQLVEQVRARVTPGRKVWIGVMHPNDIGVVARLKEELKKHYDVVALVARPTAAGVYLHAGPGSVGVAVYPVDHLPFVPPNPFA